MVKKTRAQKKRLQRRRKTQRRQRGGGVLNFIGSAASTVRKCVGSLCNGRGRRDELVNESPVNTLTDFTDPVVKKLDKNFNYVLTAELNKLSTYLMTHSPAEYQMYKQIQNSRRPTDKNPFVYSFQTKIKDALTTMGIMEEEVTSYKPIRGERTIHIVDERGGISRLIELGEEELFKEIFGNGPHTLKYIRYRENPVVAPLNSYVSLTSRGETGTRGYVRTGYVNGVRNPSEVEAGKVHRLNAENPNGVNFLSQSVPPSNYRPRRRGRASSPTGR